MCIRIAQMPAPCLYGLGICALCLTQWTCSSNAARAISRHPLSLCRPQTLVHLPDTTDNIPAKSPYDTAGLIPLLARLLYPKMRKRSGRLGGKGAPGSARTAILNYLAALDPEELGPLLELFLEPLSIAFKDPGGGVPAVDAFEGARSVYPLSSHCPWISIPRTNVIHGMIKESGPHPSQYAWKDHGSGITSLPNCIESTFCLPVALEPQYTTS